MESGARTRRSFNRLETCSALSSTTISTLVSLNPSTTTSTRDEPSSGIKLEGSEAGPRAWPCGWLNGDAADALAVALDDELVRVIEDQETKED